MKKIIRTSFLMLGTAILLCACQAEEKKETDNVQTDIEADGDEQDSEQIDAESKALTYTMKNWSHDIYKGGEQNEESRLFTANFDYPEFLGGEDEASQELNAFFQQQLKAFIAEIEGYSDLEENYAEYGEATYPWSYECKFSVSVIDNQYISISNTMDGYLGGAHGSYNTYGYVFDKQTGNAVELTEFLNQSNTDSETLNAYLVKESEQMALKKEAVLWDEYDKIIREEVAVDGNWYLTDEDLVIVANQYILSYYAAGNFVFEIPRDELVNLNKKLIETN